MKVRTPKLDYSKAHPHWSPNREFAQIQNGSSILPAHIEPYLVKVMAKAKAQLDPKETRLHAELEIFIKQEMQHCKQHLAYNKMLKECGYPGLAEIEKEYAADYERFLKEKSLRFNLAYSEGFEAMSAIGVTGFFEEFDEFLEGADETVANMWLWHLAEEYEHREVAHKVYHKLVGLDPISSYFYRVYGFFFAVAHIRSYGERASNYLLAVDRAGMSPNELKQSEARADHVKKVVRKRVMEHLCEILSPFYNPAKRPPPRGWTEFLAKFDAVDTSPAAA